MTDSPAIARQLYEALAVGDGPALDALLDPAFRGVLADGMPFGAGGGHDGADAMRRDGWAVIGRHFAARAQPERFTALEDGRLLVTGRYGGRGRRGGCGRATRGRVRRGRALGRHGGGRGGRG